MMLHGMKRMLADTTQSRTGRPSAGAEAADADAAAAADRAMQELLVRYESVAFGTLAVQTCHRAAVVNPLTHTFR